MENETSMAAKFQQAKNILGNLRRMVEHQQKHQSQKYEAEIEAGFAELQQLIYETENKVLETLTIDQFKS